MRRSLFYLKPLVFNFLLCFLAVALCGCSDSPKNIVPESALQATVTVVLPTSGVGDSGYNDSALKGILEFASATNTEISQLTPSDTGKAAEIVDLWKRQTAGGENVLLVLSADYSGIVAERAAGLADNQTILYYEDGAPAQSLRRVSSFRVRRYAAAYLAACMASAMPLTDACVVKAKAGDKPADDAEAGFLAGMRKLLPDCRLSTSILAGGFKGYNMTTEAYRLMAQMDTEKDKGARSRLIFPLAGNSNNGIYKYCREILPSMTASKCVNIPCGMDVDCSPFCPYLPFSVTVDMRSILRELLTSWKQSGSLPSHTEYTLGSGKVDVALSPSFYLPQAAWEGEPLIQDLPALFQEKKAAHLEEAKAAENANPIP